MLAPAPSRWWQLLLLRFGVIYVALIAIPSAVFVVPYGPALRHAFAKLLFPVVRWWGDNLLGLQVVVPPRGTGSGDTSFDWSFALLSLTLAAFGAALWTFLGRTRTPQPLLEIYLRLTVRYGLATNMIAYGLVKVFHFQFPYPSPERLIQTYGESSPMGLLWTFMGYSTSYSLFVGLLETLGGVLLLFRRTATLGGLIVLGAMANVVVLNFAYDVPVKIFASQLLLASIFLVWPDRHRLLAVFVLNRPAAARDLEDPAPLPAVFRRARPLLKFVVIAFLLSPTALQQARHVMKAPKLELYGVWKVLDSTGFDPSTGFPLRVTFNDWGVMSLWTNSREPLGQYPVTMSGTMLTGADRGKPVDLSVTRYEPNRFELRGTVDGREIQLLLGRNDTFPLLEHRFHWVSEAPYDF